MIGKNFPKICFLPAKIEFLPATFRFLPAKIGFLPATFRFLPA
jgi:hypothetical protein